MPKPYVCEYEVQTPNGMMVMGSVVMDREDFDALVDTFPGLGLGITAEHVAKFKEAGQVPLIKCGNKTRILFERFGIKCNMMGIIVRGKGKEILRSLNPENN